MAAFLRGFKHVVAGIRRIFGYKESKQHVEWLDSVDRDSFTAMSGWIGDETTSNVSECHFLVIYTSWATMPPKSASVYLRPPSSLAFFKVPAPNPEISFDQECYNYSSDLPPSFTYHALSIAMDLETRRCPAVRREYDCWVVHKEGLRCLGLGGRLAWDHDHTIYRAFLYDSAHVRTKVVATGMFVVPNRNVWKEKSDEEEDPVEGCVKNWVFQLWNDAVGESGHQEVQLTFEYGRLPLKSAAERLPGAKWFEKEWMALCRE